MKQSLYKRVNQAPCGWREARGWGKKRLETGGSQGEDPIIENITVWTPQLVAQVMAMEIEKSGPI